MRKSAAVEEMQLATRDVSNAPLPATYEAAKTALAQCERVDECSTWAKKAAALASYARQADDKTLEQAAVRIRARAVRRCGELLREIPAKAGHVTGGGAQPHRSERAQAAADAGLSRDQAKDALRLAKIPADDFERAVESPSPPTVAELAEIGTSRRAPLVNIEGRDPDEYNRALLFNGALKDLAAAARDIPPAVVLRGSVPRHYGRMRDSARFLSAWLSELLALMEGQ
jgi:hypothetical protein